MARSYGGFSRSAFPELAQIGSPEALEILAEVIRKRSLGRTTALESLVAGRAFIDDAIVEEIYRTEIEGKGPKGVGGSAIGTELDPFRRRELLSAAACYLALRDSSEAVAKLLGPIKQWSEIGPYGTHQYHVFESVRNALATLRSERAVQAVVEVARDPEQPLVLRRLTMEAMARTGQPGAVKALTRLLGEGSAETASAAAKALGQSGDPQAAQALQERLRMGTEDSRLLMSLLDGLDSLGVTDDLEELFLPCVKSQDAGVRARALALLGQCRGERSLLQLLAGLGDDAWEVRWQAIHGLARRDATSETVSAMIAQLCKEDDKLSQQWMRTYLQRMTGADPGRKPEAWRIWWDENRGNYDPASVRLGPLVLGSGEDRTERAIQVDEKRVVFLVDVSGSMAGEVTVGEGQESTRRTRGRKLAIVKQELLKILTSLTPETSFSIVWFSSEPSTIWNSPRPGSKRNVRKAIKAIEDLSFRGRTNIMDSLARVLKRPSVDAIYLFSDGEPNQGSLRDPDEILTQIAGLNKDGRRKIHVVDVGGSDFLKCLAEENEGRYIPLGQSE
jgi:hypothetical protein